LFIVVPFTRYNRKTSTIFPRAESTISLAPAHYDH
jgi:hypothetical protein